MSDNRHLPNVALVNANGIEAGRVGVHGGSRSAGVKDILVVGAARRELTRLNSGPSDHLLPQIKWVMTVHLENVTEIQRRSG